MPLSRALKCWLCAGATGSSSNIDKHCRRNHTHLTDCVGLQPSGLEWRVMDGNDSIIISLVKDNKSRHTRNLMYCFDCKRMYEAPASLSNPCNLFEKHCKSADTLIYRCIPYGEAKPSKMKGLPKKKATMTTPTPKRSAGIWLDEATLLGLRAKYPSLAACYRFDDARLSPDGTPEYDFMKTLDAMCQLLTVGETYEKTLRGAKTPFTGDPWAAVGSLLCEDDDTSVGYDTLTTGALQCYRADVTDWRIAKNKDASKKGLPLPFEDEEMDSDDDMSVDEIELIEPDANINRTVIRDAILDSIKKLKKKPVRAEDAVRAAPVSAPQDSVAPSSGCQSESAVRLDVEDS